MNEGKRVLHDMNTEDFNNMREMLTLIEQRIIHLDPLMQRAFYKPIQQMIVEAWLDVVSGNELFTTQH